MNKLTASIFALLVGGMAASAEAAVTSKAYVDDAIQDVNATITANVQSLAQDINAVADDVDDLKSTVQEHTETLTSIVEGDGAGSVADKIAAALQAYTNTEGMNAAIAVAKGEAIASAKAAGDEAYAVKSTESIASTANTNASQALTNIGTLANLTTEDKTSAVAAINEVNTVVNAIDGDVTDLQADVTGLKTTVGQKENAGNKTNQITDTNLNSDVAFPTVGAVVSWTNSEIAKLNDSGLPVNPDKISNGTITGDKLANETITSGKLAEGSVTTDKIADEAVTSAKLADIIAAGTATKVTYNAKGQITATSALTKDDLPELTASDIVGLKRLATADVPAGCETGTCVLKFDGTNYSWENIAETYVAPSGN